MTARVKEPDAIEARVNTAFRVALLLGCDSATAEAAVLDGIIACEDLSSSPGSTGSLHTWLFYRCFTAKGRERVPLFGEFGLVSQLGNVEYARPRKFREKLDGWLTVIWIMWPEYPAFIDRGGTSLIVDRERAVLHRSRSMPGSAEKLTTCLAQEIGMAGIGG